MKTGKIKPKQNKCLTTHFKELKIGDRVALVYNPSFPVFAPKRVEGRTGIITAQRGEAYILKVRQGTRNKQFIIKSAHLKKIESPK
ncbi:hypothetical protein J4433_02585 [Candidatus Pacearchaeota archaeon]|nr:hypothetical protein [Candidatus Pacearchaeota archaeon]